MKTTIQLLFATLLFALVISGCKKDEETKPTPTNPTSNFIKFNNTYYTLNKGILENYGTYASNVDNIDWTSFSPGITLYESNNQIDSISGNGHAIFFETITPSGNQLGLGVYSYDEAGNGTVNTFISSGAIFNFDIMNYTGTEVEITGGTLTVVTSAPNYKINFSCTTDDGKSVSGNYTGTLKYYDYSKKKLGKPKFRSILK